MEYREFLYTPKKTGAVTLRKVYIITENDTYIEGYDLSGIEEKEIYEQMESTLKMATAGSRFKEYNSYFRRFLKNRLSLKDIAEIKEQIIL